MAPLLSLLAITASPVFVQSAQGQAEAGQYVLHIQGEAALEPQQISGRIEGRRLTVHVQGGRARSENRTWGNGEGHVRAFRHRESLELEARLPDTNCKSGVNVAAGAKGSVLVSVSCPALSASAPATNATQALVVAGQSGKAAPSGLLAAVALPPAPVEPAASKSASASPAPGPAAMPTGAASPAPVELRARSPEAAAPEAPHASDLVPAKPAPKPQGSQPGAEASAPTSSPASLWGVAFKALMPVLILAGLAMVALKFARKRRGLGRHVQILETTSLGPKRSLIVAKVGSETLLLGASEAGIALIQVRPSSAGDEDGLNARAVPAPEQADEPEAFWVDTLKRVKGDKDEPAAEAGQVKSLSRLFRKQRQDIPDAWPFANVLDASMLEDSLEDRELREKLALGMEARVP